MRTRLATPLGHGAGRRRLGDESGATAVEFALVAPLFFAIVYAILELGVMMLAGLLLEDAAADAARVLRTGQVQASGDPLVAFRTEVCRDLLGMIDCASLGTDVRSFPSFSAVSLPPVTFDADGNPTNLQFAPGAAREIMTIRLVYRWDFALPFMARLYGGEDGSRLLMTTTVVKGEPWD